MAFTLRPAGQDDLPHLTTLYQRAFPDEPLLPLVEALMTWGVLALVAVDDVGTVAGHVMLSPCSVGGGHDAVALLGPLAVLPMMQRRGLGRALVAGGLERLAARGVVKVLVLGDPAYYSRLGFVPERTITAPYPMPDEWQTAWQSQTLNPAGDLVAGPLSVLPPWQKKALWSP